MKDVKALAELFKEIKKIFTEGVNFKKIKEIFKKLPPKLKEMVRNFIMKNVVLVLLKYVILPICVISLVVALFLGIFGAILEFLKNLLGTMSKGIKYFLGGRSGLVSTDEILAIKQELEQSGVEFDEIGYLGEAYVTDFKNESYSIFNEDRSKEEYEEDLKYHTINVKGFSYGGYQTGDVFEANTTNGVIPEDDETVPALIEYAKFLNKNIDSQLKKDEMYEKEVTVSESDDISEILKNSYADSKGKNVRIKVEAQKDVDGKQVTVYTYKTIKVNSDYTYSDLPQEDDYYREFEGLKSNAILFYLKKYRDTQEYTVGARHRLTMDKSDAGAIVATFADAEEREEAGVAPGQYIINDTYVGFSQKVYYDTSDGGQNTGKLSWTDIVILLDPILWGLQEFGFLPDYQYIDTGDWKANTFSIGQQQNEGDKETHFFIRMKDEKRDDANNPDITDDVYEIAMFWQYPFAFHNNTLAPDIGYRVAILGKKFHKLVEQIFILKPYIEDDEGLLTEDGKNVNGHSSSEYVEGLDKLSVSSSGYVKVVKTYQSTWYKIKKYEYKEVVAKRIPKGEIYSATYYKYDGTDSEGNKQYKDKGPKNYYVSGSSGGSKAGENIQVGSDYYHLNSVVSKVEEVIPTLQLKSSTEKFNEKGIRGMDNIVKSLPEYEIDDTTKTVALKKSQLEDLKYYYTANKYIQGNTGTYKYTLYNSWSFMGDDDDIEVTDYIKGKTILDISTNAQSIIDSVYEIYEEPTQETIDNKERETKLARGEKLTSEELNTLYESDHDTEKDYTLAKPIVKELIAYFYDLGALNGEQFAQIAKEIKNPVLDPYSTMEGSYWVWPLKQEDIDYTYDASTNIAKMKCDMDTTVVAPTDGTVKKIINEGGGKYTVIIETKYSFDCHIGNIIGGEVISTKQEIILTNLKSVTVSEGDTVASGQEIGKADNFITYQVTGNSESIYSKKDLEKMKEYTSTAEGAFGFPLDGGLSNYSVTSEFGYRTDPFTGEWTGHGGIDIGRCNGQTVYAVSDGTVLKAEGGQWTTDWGRRVLIDHGGNLYTQYAHLEQVFVSSGQQVKAGDPIGIVGSTGRSTGAHLHFEVYEGNTQLTSRVNPRPYLEGARGKAGYFKQASIGGGATDILEMINSWEGVGTSPIEDNCYVAYWDTQADVLTIGHGVNVNANLDHFTKRGISISPSKAGVGTKINVDIVDEIQYEIFNEIKDEVISYLKKGKVYEKLTDYQIDALTCRAYMEGPYGSIRERNGKTFAQAYTQYGDTDELFYNYLYYGSYQNDLGHMRRRKAEWVLFHTGTYMKNEETTYDRTKLASAACN